MTQLKRLVVCVTLLLSFVVTTFAQDNLDQLARNNFDDAEKLMKGYLDPAMQATSLALNQGWYNTAKPHKVAGFDLTVTVNAMMIPEEDLFYQPNNLGLQQMRLSAGSPDDPFAPTILGPSRAPEYEVLLNGQPTGETFNGPGGYDLKNNVGLNWVPVPMAVLGFGLPKNTDVKLRYCPTLRLAGGETKFSAFGIGVMHDVKQWIPGIKTLPFDLSGFAGYTYMKATSDFDQSYTQDASGLFEMSALTVQGIISKKISVLTVYGATGYNITGAKLALLGSYDIDDPPDGFEEHEKDPISLNFASSGPRMTAGFRLKLAVLTIHADYTLQKYSCISFGLGINVR